MVVRYVSFHDGHVTFDASRRTSAKKLSGPPRRAGVGVKSFDVSSAIP
jgi:hypothetical protein